MLLLFACTAPEKLPDSELQESPVEQTSAFQAFHAEVTALGLKNVVVVQPDTLRADRLPFYGGPHATLPATGDLPGWAVWADAYSASSWTFPSVASLLSSVDVYEHGLMDVRSTRPGVAEAPLWQRRLGMALTHTGYFNGNSGMLLTNLTEGWERVELGEANPDNGVDLVHRAMDWLDHLPRGEPYFLLIQPMDAHSPWRPADEDLGIWSDPGSLPFSIHDDENTQKNLLQTAANAADETEEAELRENMLALYDEELLGLDRMLSELLAGLESRGRLADSLVVLTADHGETFFESRDTFGHGGSLRQELVHIPLAIYHPSLTTKVIEDCPIGNMDLLPMIGGWVGWPELVSPMEDCRPAVASSFYRLENEETMILERAATIGPRSRVEADCQNGKVIAYDLVDDPEGRSEREVERVEGAPELLDALRIKISDIHARRPEIACIEF